MSATIERFGAKISPEAPVAIYGRKRPEIAYHITGRSFDHFSYPDPKVPGDTELVRISEFLKRPQEVFLLTSREELKKLELQFASLSSFLKVRDEGRVAWSREYVLVSNK